MIPDEVLGLAEPRRILCQTSLTDMPSSIRAVPSPALAPPVMDAEVALTVLSLVAVLGAPPEAIQEPRPPRPDTLPDRITRYGPPRLSPIGPRPTLDTLQTDLPRLVSGTLPYGIVPAAECGLLVRPSDTKGLLTPPDISRHANDTVRVVMAVRTEGWPPPLGAPPFPRPTELSLPRESVACPRMDDACPRDTSRC